MNLHYILLVAISLALLVSQNAYATSTIDWLYDDVFYCSPCDPVSVNTGNLLSNSLPMRLHIVDDAFVNSDLSDHITATIASSNAHDSISIQLDESSDGNFISGPILFMHSQNTRFGTEDTPTITVEDPAFAGNGGPPDVLSAANFDNGVFVFDADKIIELCDNDDDKRILQNDEIDCFMQNGIALDLFEDGDTGIFKRTLEFCTEPNCSDASTAKLWVSEGDFISVVDLSTFSFINGIITPTPSTKGTIMVAFIDQQTNLWIDPDNCQCAWNPEVVTASYNGADSLVFIPGIENAPGRGGGGLIRPGLIIDAVLGLGGSAGQKNPTLGLDSFEKRIVEDGFSFNGNPVDVNLYYTPYPLITTPVGQNNTIKLKIFENRGPDNIAHVGLSYGLGKGETFNEGRVTIEYDRTFDGIESVTVFDPKDVIGSVNVTTAEVSCSQNNNEICLEVAFDHMFRESLEYNMVATNIWDFQRNGWQNYFNHGIHIVGESMNPPEQYSGIHRGHIYHLTETGKDTAIDEEGNSWTFDRIWNRDYIKPVKEDIDILNPNKVSAIEKLGFEYSDGQEIFGFDRVDHRFTDTRYQEQNKAQTIMASLCSACQEEPFENIDEVLTHDMPDRQSKLENSADKMKIEEQKAQKFLKQYFAQMYPGKIND